MWDESHFNMCEEIPDKMATNVIISGIPSFIQKLWIIVNDPITDPFICWDYNGHSFHVLDSVNFSQKILPRYFKHSNLSSFIRQLNLYGFRKVTDLEQGLYPAESFHYCHPAFSRGNQADLVHIRRNINTVPRGTYNTLGPNSRPTITLDDFESMSDPDISLMTGDIRRLKQRVTGLESSLDELKYENNCLREELGRVDATCKNQHQVITKLISVIATFIGSVDTNLLRIDPRTVPQLLEWLPRLTQDNQDLTALVSPQPNKALVVEDLSNLNALSPPFLTDWKAPVNNHQERNLVKIVENEGTKNKKINSWKYNRETNSFDPF